MLPLILFLFFIHIICSETHSQQYDSWSIDRFIKKYANPNWKFSFDTIQNNSLATKNLFFKDHRLPVPYTTVFTQSIEPQMFQFVIKKDGDFETIDNNAVLTIKTIYKKKYLSGIINKMLLTLNLIHHDEDEKTHFNFINNYENVIKLCIWLHEHIKNGVLYDDDMAIYGWLHQLIYAIEKCNVQFLYPWLATEMYCVFSRTRFSECVLEKITSLNNELDSANNQMPDNNINIPSTIVFDDADSFYNLLLGNIIFSSNTPKTLLDDLPNNIVIIEKNNQKVIDFFKKLVEKYNPIAILVEKYNPTYNSNDISTTNIAITIIHQLLKLITHTDETLMNNDRITIVYPFTFLIPNKRHIHKIISTL